MKLRLRLIVWLVLPLILFSVVQAQTMKMDTETQLSKLTVPNGGSADLFGSSVGIGGDVVIVGAPHIAVGSHLAQGAAFVFVKPAGGWSTAMLPAARLIASDGQTGDQFGFSVAISGDSVVVGARYAKEGSNLAQGAAYVFSKPVGGWSGDINESAKLLAGDGVANDTFGEAVAIDGTTIAIGADNAMIGSHPHQGAVYLFLAPPGGWSGTLNQNSKLTSSDGLADDFLGLPVSVSGDVVAAGARFAHIGENSDQGSAYIFVRPAGGWGSGLSQSAKLTASDGAALDEFGSGLALNGSTIVVGAPGTTVNHNMSQGSVYVFMMPPGGWSGSLTQNAKLSAPDGGPLYHFGGAVGMSGKNVLVGATGTKIGINGDQGSAYLFSEPAGGWSGSLTSAGELTALDGAAGDTFGNAVAINGATLVVGAYQAIIGANLQQGAAYIFPTTLTSFTYLPFIHH